MKLRKIQVQNFRSVEDSNVFSAEDLTCLVGKNEAGKTALLHALHAINPFNKAATAFDVDKDYPRRFVTRYKDRHTDNMAPVIRTWWQISDAAKEELVAEYGETEITSNEAQVARFYNYKYLY